MIQKSPAATGTELTEATSPPPVVRLRSGLPAKEMLRHLARASRATDVGNRTLAFYLQELHARREYQTLGYATAVHLAT